MRSTKVKTPPGGGHGGREPAVETGTTEHAEARAPDAKRQEAEALYLANQGLARFFLRRYGSRLLALNCPEEDLLQEIRCHLWCAAQSYDAGRPETFATWAGVRVRNRLWNLTRDMTREKRFAPLPPVSLHAPLPGGEEELTCEDVLAGGDDVETACCAGADFDAFCQSLSPRARAALELRLAGYRQREIAARLGVTQARVSQYLKKAAKFARAYQ